MTFDTFGLSQEILNNVKKAGYTEPTPVQRATIPLVLKGKDVLGCAQTGTGKTAAFALPVLQRLNDIPSGRRDATVIRVLVLSPTRELAQQTYENFVLYSHGLKQKSCVIFGGVSQVSQVNALNEGADVVIACPGRLLDLIGQGYVRLDHVEVFVLDEADRMLDMGFIHDVRKIVRLLPERHQSLLFSATMPGDVEKLAMELLKDPENIKVDPVTSTVEAIDQCLYYVDKANKRHLLAEILSRPDVESALVFSRTKHGVDRIVRDLTRGGIEAGGIHGDKSQLARQTALNRFRDGRSKVLVATDIAARGLDISGLSHVINFDMPMEAESYIHRIGRTGRAGRAGKAISFCCIDEVKQLNQVEKLIGKRLREEKSEWPMQVLTPTEKKPREPRPEKLTGTGKKPVKHASIVMTEKAGCAAPERSGSGDKVRTASNVKQDRRTETDSGNLSRKLHRVTDNREQVCGKRSTSVMRSGVPEDRRHAARDSRNRAHGTGRPVHRVNRRTGR